mgnify:CR=1 FL=1
MANTFPTTEVQKQPSGILASCSKEIQAVVTSDVTTTARLDFTAFMAGTVKNSSGATDTITWYAADHLKGAAYQLYDEDGADVTQAVANNTIWALPAACAGCAILIPVGSVASATLQLVFKR